jgi:hypothetical protein
MTVGELISNLQMYDSNMRVVVDGYEDGCDDPKLKITDVVFDSNWTGSEKIHDWSGRHDYADELSLLSNTKHISTKAILVGR